MRKMLLQLVAEMRRLGATVVAADFSSVILSPPASTASQQPSGELGGCWSSLDLCPNPLL